MDNYIWAAGFFDGEGSVGAYDNGSGSLHLMIQVNQKYPGLLYKLKRTFKTGNITGPYYKGKFPLYRWAVRNKEGINKVFNLMWPWLGTRKRKQYLEAKRNARSQKR